MPEAAQERRKSRCRLAASARRALIDEAATRVFAERGYEAATMQGIAQAAGVVASVLYDHYPSKRELYDTLLVEHGRTLIERSVRPPTGSDLRAELHDRIDDFFRTIERDPFVWRMLFRDPPGDAEIGATHRRVQASATKAIAAVLGAGREGFAPPEETTDPTAAVMVAEMAKSSLNALARWWWDHREVRREAVVDTATTLLWDGLSRVVNEAASIDRAIRPGG